MKKPIALIVLMVPLCGCASLTDFVIPAPRLLVGEVFLAGGGTNAPVSVKPFKWFYNSCADNDRLNSLCKIKHMVNQYAYKVVDKEHEILTEPARAAGNNAIQGVLGMLALAGGPAAMVAHKMGLKKPSPEHLKEVKAAGEMDPEEFKSKA